MKQRLLKIVRFLCAVCVLPEDLAASGEVWQPEESAVDNRNARRNN